MRTDNWLFSLPAERLSQTDDDYEDFSTSVSDMTNLCSPGGIGQYTCTLKQQLYHFEKASGLLHWFISGLQVYKQECKNKTLTN